MLDFQRRAVTVHGSSLPSQAGTTEDAAWWPAVTGVVPRCPAIIGLHVTNQLAEFLIWIGPYLNSVMTGLWVFILGACIGSFLNVVIYRLPAGMALSHPGSRCPFCETELGARDNIPILGWVLLKGKCRYCSVSIAPRYPLVETLTGLLFLTLFLIETNRGAANLPLVPVGRVQIGAFDAVFQLGRWELLAWFCVHAFYLTVVLAMSMIAIDGHHTPVRLTSAGLLTGLLVGLCWPDMRPVHAVEPFPHVWETYWGIHWQAPGWLGRRAMTTGVGLAGLIDGVAGIGSGLATGALASRAFGGRSPLESALRSAFLMAGVFCGWQFTWPLLTVVLITIAILSVFSAPAQRDGQALLLFAASAILLLYWERLVDGILLIGYDGWRWTSAGATTDWPITMGVLAALAWGLSWIRRSDDGLEDDTSDRQSAEPGLSQH